MESSKNAVQRFPCWNPQPHSSRSAGNRGSSSQRTNLFYRKATLAARSQCPEDQIITLQKHWDLRQSEAKAIHRSRGYQLLLLNLTLSPVARVLPQGTATDCRSLRIFKGDTTMKEQLIQEVQRQMLSFLNNAQLKQLQSVLEGVLSGVELSHSADMVEAQRSIRLPVFHQHKTH